MMRFIISIFLLGGLAAEPIKAINMNINGDTAVNRAVELEEVVVLSAKQHKTYRLSPLSATVLSASLLQSQRLNNMKDFSSFIPNLFMPDYGSKLTAPLYIRGIGSKINAPSVGLYVDGMPYFEKSSFDFDFAEVERVEVLRGPQGTLYGRNTMGGIINIYTRSPLDFQGTRLSAGGGSYANLDAAAAHYGKVGEGMGFVLSGGYHHSDGYFTNLYTGGKADAVEAATGKIRLEWKANAGLTLRLISGVDYSDQGGYPYGVYNKDKQQAGAVNYDDYSSYRRLIATTGLGLEYRRAGYLLSSQSSFQYLADRQGIDQDFTDQPVVFAIQRQQQRALSEEFNIKSLGDGRYQWLFGAFGFRQGVDNDVKLDYKSLGYIAQRFYDIPTWGYAFYHQSTVNDLLVDGLSLTLGARYDYERAKIDYEEERQAGGSSVNAGKDFEGGLRFHQFTPKVALQYLRPAFGLLYASVSKGYKTGGFNLSTDTEENRSFRPEQSWNYEVGGKFNLWERRLHAEVALFYIDWRHQQINQPLPGGQMLKNAGKSESKGVEVTLDARPTPAVRLQASYGYTRARFKEYQKGEVSYRNKRLPYIPKQTLSINGEYTLERPFSCVDRLLFSASYTGSDRHYWDDANSAYQSYYGLLNAQISITSGVATLSLWGRNITNRRYTAYYFTAGSPSTGYSQNGKPLTVGGTISLTL